MKELIDRKDPILRQKAEEVDIEKIKSKEIQGVIKNMKDTLQKEEDGVAIAAPQIGVSLKIFVISHTVLNKADQKYKEEKDTVYINPKIIKLSKEKEWLDEGCLSLRWLYGKVERSVKATIKAYDEKGNLFERGASGLLAQVFQHETDHLEGVLFIDKAKDVEDMPPKK